MRPNIDPRLGNIEDDASSSKRRSLLSLAGSLLVEISLPKLAVAWMLLIVVPCCAWDCTDRRFDLAQQALLHANDPLYAILITGDMTDAGRSTEWAEFFDAVAHHPSLTELMLMMPENHDLNIVDRANPTRLELPTSPKKRLRKARALSAMAAIQGARIRVVDRSSGRLGESLAAELVPHLGKMVTIANAGKLLLTRVLLELWTRAFPMVLPPDRDDGLGIILLNSNAETHF